MALTRSEKTQLGVLKTKQENSDTFGPLTPQEQKTLEELQQKQGDQSSLFDNLGIFSTLEAAEVDPRSKSILLDTPGYFGADGKQGVGAMDRETPFGDRLQPTIPTGGSIFSNRQFGNIRAGQPELGIFGVPAVQDLPVDFSELDDLEAQDAEYLDLIQKAREAESPGILQNIINNTLIGRGLDFLQDQFQYRPADASITSTPLAQFAFRNQLARDPSFNIAAALNKQNALGGYYSDFARGQRQLAGRFSNLLDRARSGKTFSERNLLGISRALGTPLTRDDISNITEGVFNITPGTFTAKSLSDSFAGEEGPASTATMSASDFSDDTAGTPF